MSKTSVASFRNFYNLYPLNPLILVLISCIVSVVTLAALVFSVLSGHAQFERLGLINGASVILFITCCIVSLYSTKAYFFLLPFIFIAFPAAVNDFFPSIFLGHPNEYGASAFPLITHIDLFLFLGIFKKSLLSRIYMKSNLLLVIVCSLFFFSFVVNVATSPDTQHTLLLVAGLFPLRYLILLIALLSNYDVRTYERQIIFSLMCAIFFLLIEALINTAVTNPTELASGTLGSNTFANVTVSILIFYIFIKRKHFPVNNILFLAFVACSALIIILTGTRIAILAGAVTFFILQAYLFKWYKLAIVFFWIGIIAIGIYNYIEVPNRYSYKFLSSKIHFHGFSGRFENIVTIELSQETSSIVTRLRLYRTAIYMLIENPVWGTGYGTFNYLKDEYGFEAMVLIDAHNGYLNTLAQLGLSSVFFLYLIYLYPILNFKEFQGQTFLASLAIINLTMAICDLSNAGIYKHSAFALLAFNAVVISMLKKQKSLE